MGETSSGQSETSKCFHTLPALQNGGLTLTEGPASGERFPVQIGPKIRIFLRPTGKEIQEIPSFPLGRKLVRVPLHVCWPRTRPCDIYKADEDSNLAFKTDKHKSNSLSRRFSINGSNDRVSGDGKRHHHLSFATPGLCNKSGKIPDDTDQANRIHRDTSGFREDDCITSTRQSGEINQQVSNSSGTAKNDSSRVDQTNRKNVLCHTSSGTSQTPTQVFTVATDKRVAIERVLQYKNNPEQKIITGNYMVEEKSCNVQWETTECVASGYDNPDRCLDGRLVAHCQGIAIGGKWSKQESYKYINILEMIAVKLALLTFMKTRKVTSVHFQIDNIVALTYVIKMGGLHNQELLNLAKDIWEYAFHHMITITAEYIPSHLNVEADWESRNKVHKRVKTGPRNISSNNIDIGHPRHRFVRFQVVTTTPSLHGLETRSRQQRNRCNATDLEEPVSICLSTRFNDRTSTSQSSERTGSNSDSNTSMAKPAMVCHFTEHVSEEPIAVTSDKEFVKKSNGSGTLISQKTITKISGMGGVRTKMAANDLSETASMLITNSRRKSTLSRYNSAWGKWSSWCGKQQINPVRCDVKYVLNYLGGLFQNWLEYSTINGHRSPISAYYQRVDALPVGQHPEVCLFVCLFVIVWSF